MIRIFLHTFFVEKKRAEKEWDAGALGDVRPASGLSEIRATALMQKPWEHLRAHCERRGRKELDIGSWGKQTVTGWVRIWIGTYDDVVGAGGETSFCCGDDRSALRPGKKMPGREEFQTPPLWWMSTLKAISEYWGQLNQTRGLVFLPATISPILTEDLPLLGGIPFECTTGCQWMDRIA